MRPGRGRGAAPQCREVALRLRLRWAGGTGRTGGNWENWGDMTGTGGNWGEQGELGGTGGPGSVWERLMGSVGDQQGMGTGAPLVPEGSVPARGWDVTPGDSDCHSDKHRRQHGARSL